MPDSPAKKTFLQPKGVDATQSPRRRFPPGQRDPLLLPKDKIELPMPTPFPGQAPSINLLTSIGPPVMIVVVNIAAALISGQINPTAIILSMGVAVGFPVFTVASFLSQKKKYKKNLEQRELAYRQRLKEEKKRLDGMVQTQRYLLEESYPTMAVLEKTALQATKALWSRRPPDNDFLELRFGAWEGVPSFTIEPIRYMDQNDKLPLLAMSVTKGFQKVSNLPALLPLAKLGSLAISGRASSVYGLARRLVMDLVVHHSPQDVNIAVLGDTREAVENWEWLKWVAHTDALGLEQRVQRLAFDPHKIDKYLESLMHEYQLRRSQADNFSSSKNRAGNQPAIVVLLDDSGQVRQHGDIRALAEYGHEARIYLFFIGGRDWPRECRSRIDLLDEQNFKLTETFSRSGELKEGTYETVSRPDCERIARKLAGWEVAGSASRVPLPESIRLSRVLGTEAMQVEAVKGSWSASFQPGDLLQFPIGVCARREQLDLAMVNLLPAERGGNDAYHTILIGTTGSGKSEFMKSLVMGAAVRYPPNLLNFFFLDFKGGAAFSIFEELPHVSGVVTNLKPELVERGLDSIKNEIERRQGEFAQARLQNIWDYNRLNPDKVLPHLVLLLDEFARGLADFPRLRETLDVLVRQGRSLGMYLILANQDVNSEVDRLLNNVGWRIALKVAKPDEMSMIDRTLPNAQRAGQGYLRSLVGDVIEFQAGYGGLPLQVESAAGADEFTIYEVEADGSYKQTYKKAAEAIHEDKQGKGPIVKEEERIINTLKQATADLHIKPAPRIYLDPLPEVIPLETVLAEAGVTPSYKEKTWSIDHEIRRAVAYWGKQDIPQMCLQETLRTEFADKDGHLWMVGAQGSGKDITLASLLMSIALTYTPEQAQFYLIELGAGELTPFEGLPHTGALIKPAKDNKRENERLIRLLDLLDGQMENRKSTGDTNEAGLPRHPSLFVVINSFAELQKNFPDDVERMTRVVRDGGPLGIHFIIVTSRGPELVRSISNIIARRLVLQMANKDEYIDIIGRQVVPLTSNIPGRGYWVDGDVSICQAAQPPEKLKETIKGMREAWKGELPAHIEVLADCVSLSEFFAKAGTKPGQVPIPVGFSYATLAAIAPDLGTSSPAWLVMGPKETGKSNFLACTALSALQHAPDNWQVRIYALRRSNVIKWDQLDKRIQVFSTTDEIMADLQALSALLKAGKPPVKGKKLLLLIDELGASFQQGKETLAKEINDLALLLEMTTEVHVMASGVLEELRMQLTSPMVRFLRQSRVGLMLSKDTNEADWLGAQVSLEFRRMTLPPGRGFFINKGKAEFIQTPCLDKGTA